MRTKSLQKKAPNGTELVFCTSSRSPPRNMHAGCEISFNGHFGAPAEPPHSKMMHRMLRLPILKLDCTNAPETASAPGLLQDLLDAVCARRVRLEACVLLLAPLLHLRLHVRTGLLVLRVPL